MVLVCRALVEGVQVTRRGVPVCLFLFGAIVILHHVEVMVHAETLSLSCYGGVMLTGFCLVVFYRDLTCTDMFGFAQTHRLSTVPGSAEEKLSTLVMVKCVDLSEDFFCRLPYQGLGIYCSFVISESPCTINL